jgi:hypothetical protein
MKNETELANFALTALKKGSLNSIEDPGKAGQLCQTWIGPAIRNVLKGATIHRLVARETIYPNGDPLGAWPYRYEVPNDAVKIVGYLDAAGNPAEWESEGGFIFSTSLPLVLHYVRFPTDIGDVPETIAQACGFQLALMIGPGLDVDEDILGRVNAQLREHRDVGAIQDELDHKPKTKSRTWGSPRYS